MDTDPTPTHGGARKGAGRKPKYDQAMNSHTVRLTPAQADALREHGNGSLSGGVQRAAQNLIDGE